MLARVQKKIQKQTAQIAQIPSDISYRIERAKHAQYLPKLSVSDQQIVDTCEKQGVCVTSLEELGFASTSAMLQAAHSYLNAMESIRPKQSLENFDPNQPPEALHPQIFTMTDLPEFAAWGQEPRLLNIVENYIGLPIAFQGIHLRRDFANPSPITTELWHQDLEDRRILKAIVYLSDVLEEKDGPFEYIPKSQVSPLLAQRIHRKIAQAWALGIPDQEMKKLVPRSAWRYCTGRAGTVVLMDPKNIFHHGKSRLKERAALFYVYTAANPLHPEHCTQYSDGTFARPEMAQSSAV
jgi:hypothetical protein